MKPHSRRQSKGLYALATRPETQEELGELDGDAYERWGAMNGPKTWSLAASLHPEIAAAYDAAQDRAAGQIIGWAAEHATTRVGPRGRQGQVPVEFSSPNSDRSRASLSWSATSASLLFARSRLPSDDRPYSVIDNLDDDQHSAGSSRQTGR